MNEKLAWVNSKRKLSELIPWERNPRKIGADQQQRLNNSLLEFAQVETIAIGPNNEVYNGHQRLTAWAEEYGDIIVDVRIANRPLTEKEREKLTVYLHKGAAGEWDFSKLADFDAADLKAWGLDASDLENCGFKQIDNGGAVDAEPQIDKAAELREKWGVETGQLWQLGDHRLLCGDSTKADDVARVIGGEKAQLAVTSPPYGVGKDYEQGGVDEWLATIRGCFSVAVQHAPLWFVNLGNKRTGNEGFELNNFSMMEAEFTRLGLRLVALRIWSKDPAWAGQNPYWLQTYKPVDDFEFLGLFAAEKPKHKKRLTDEEYKQWGWRGVWEFASVRANDVHSAAYPVELPRRAIKWLCDDNAIIYEPFSGSGTTIIAAEQLNRRCYSIEISPAYCAVTLQRWADATGKTPVLLE